MGLPPFCVRPPRARSSVAGRGTGRATGVVISPYPSDPAPCVTRLADAGPGRSAWRPPGVGSAAAMAIADEVQRIGAPVRRWARHQKREYTQGEPRPLGADLGAMGVYLGLVSRSEEHTSELQSRQYLVCRLLLEKKKKIKQHII